ncbi:hypothetical protein AMJ87_12690 [candidate division WOR_3 bacterium SM23_60]|uniref:Uncharacterized protein n=1 Tax=candidate division WOR_3 bacterium SM23_60 TaxID=1703780 RepID=A0A0S8G5T3_UNCW3|nr:MAG: hypothetical protein AMJ87_12690 [candidate division WOR_3 bacterium SM23_60]
MIKRFFTKIFSGTELIGTINLVSGLIMVLLVSYFSSRWWSAAFGFLAVFFLIEAVWHYILTDYLRHIHRDR